MNDATGKYSLSGTTDFDAAGFCGKVFIDKKQGAGFNALLVTVNGRHPKKKMIDTTRNYYVVEGSGTFTLDDTPYQLSAGDLFIVGAGHTYEYEGTMKLFEFNVSFDNSFKDEVLN